MDASVTIVATIPVGLITDYAGSTIPFGWLLLDGSVISQSTYANLFLVIGTTYNTGSEGAGNFRLPDARGRVTVGAGSGSGLTNRVLAAKFGEETHTLTEAEMPNHNHTQNPHSHSIPAAVNPTTVLGGSSSAATASSSTTGSTTATNNPTGGGLAHNNMQPSLVMNKIIKY